MILWEISDAEACFFECPYAQAVAILAGMKVLYFAQAAKLAGCREEQWDVSDAMTHQDFWQEVMRRHPALAALQSQCRIAADGEYLQAGDCLKPNGGAAVIPPVSGG